MLKNAVQSVLAQTKLVKVHILDNASTDGTPNWLQELQSSEGARIELTLRNENIGALANFSEGFSSVTTQYCVPLADDDELLPNFLQKALEIVEKTPGIGGVVFQTKRNHPDGNFDISPDFEFEGVVNPHKHIELWCRSGHYVSWSSILWNSKITSSADFLSNISRFTFFGDAWLQFIAISKYDFYLKGEIGAVFNLHNNQCSQEVSLKLIKDYVDIFNLVSDCIDLQKSITKKVKLYSKKNLLKNWNSMVKSQCDKTSNKIPQKAKNKMIKYYINNIKTNDILEDFPFSSFFKQDILKSYNSAKKPAPIFFDRIKSKLLNLNYLSICIQRIILSGFRHVK